MVSEVALGMEVKTSGFVFLHFCWMLSRVCIWMALNTGLNLEKLHKMAFFKAVLLDEELHKRAVEILMGSPSNSPQKEYMC